MIIEIENENLVSGQGKVICTSLDDHEIHMRLHTKFLREQDPKDMELTRRFLKHIREHVDMLQEADPEVDYIRGQVEKEFKKRL